MFRRRNPKTYLRLLADLFYPQGGWSRAVSYILHRVRRLPDPPHRIARGVAAGVMVCFTPFFGLHFVLATLLALAMQGNLIAALLATFLGNPVTFPFIAALALELGNWMLGAERIIMLHELFAAFRHAFAQSGRNLRAIFTDDVAHWDQLWQFFSGIFWPYLVGGIIPGVIAGVIAYYLTVPAVAAYQKARIKRLKARYKKRRALTPSKG